MEFGRHHNPKEVDFQIPPWKSISEPINPVNKMAVFIGGTSWINPSWKGHLYLENFKKGEDLFYYSRQFNSIELNSTYYGIPKVQRVKKWCEAVPADFKFCPKFPQQISKATTLNFPKNQLTDYLEVLYTFEEKLGVPFFQFPTKLNPAAILNRLKDLLQLVPPDIKIMFEIRHSDSYEPGNIQLLIEMLQSKSHSLVITDTPGSRTIIHNLILTDIVFIRFVSCGVFQIDQMRLNQWILRLSELPNLGVNTVYFFVHEGETNPLPELALYLSEKIRYIPNYIFRGPQLINETPEQMTLF